MGYVAALVLLAGAVLAPAWLQWSDDPAVAAALAAADRPAPTSISDYDATFDLRPDGTLEVEEQLTVDLPSYDATTAGLTRYFDSVDDSDEGVRRRVDDVTATLDGEAVPVRMSTAERGRFDVATVGDPDQPVAPGEHRYVLRYRVPHAVEPGYEGSPGSLHWDLVPWTWQQEVEQAEITVELPSPARDVQCGVGRADAPAPCDDVVGQGTDTLVVRTGRLPEHTPVRIRLGVESPASDGPRLPWRPRFDVVLGRSVPVLGAVLGGAVVAGLLGLLLARRSRERPPAASSVGEPPVGLGPAQAAYVMAGRAERTHYVASLLHAAQHGAVDVTRRGPGWSVTDRSGTYGWAGLDPVTAQVAHLVGVRGTTFAVEATSAAAGERLSGELAASRARTQEWARTAGLERTTRPSRVPAVLVVAAVVAVAVVVVWNPLSLSVLALVPGLFAVAALPRLATRPVLRRTPAGREAWAAARGFDRVLAAGPGEDRIDLRGREDLYTAYVPWAVAFGRTEEWAATYRESTGHEPPSAHRVADLDAAVSGALASYEASLAGTGKRRARSRRRLRRS